MAQAEDGDKDSPPIELDELLRDFNPEESFIDRMLLYQVTGRELNQCMSQWRRNPHPPVDDFYLPYQDSSTPL